MIKAGATALPSNLFPAEQPTPSTHNEKVPAREALYTDIRDLLAASATTNKHDLVHNLIVACLEHGLQERSRIIGVARRFGFKPQHTALILKDHAGAEPAGYDWFAFEPDRYQLHGNSAAAG